MKSLPEYWIHTPLDYSSPADLLTEKDFNISPSQFAKFVFTPWKWYRAVILEEDDFVGSTSTVIGTIVHYCAEQASRFEKIDREAINTYINNHGSDEDFPDVDIQTVHDEWYDISQKLVDDYVEPNRLNFYESELGVLHRLGGNYYVGGTIDRIETLGGEKWRIVDYKTYKSKTKPKSISRDHKIQLLAYAYMYNRTKVEEVRIVYINRHIEGEISPKTQKKLKSYPSEVTVITEPVTKEDMDYIYSMFELCKLKREATKKYPKLKREIWHDPRLKD